MQTELAVCPAPPSARPDPAPSLRACTRQLRVPRLRVSFRPGVRVGDPGVHWLWFPPSPFAVAPVPTGC
eukprot:355647-Chlamydomonas_euryale.AAC.3